MSKLTPIIQTNDDGSLTVGFDEFPGQEFNLSDLQAEDAKIVRIYHDKDRKVLSLGEGWWLVAEVTLPGIEYREEPALDENGDPVLDDQGNPQVTVVRVPLSADSIEVKLWDLP